MNKTQRAYKPKHMAENECGEQDAGLIVAYVFAALAMLVLILAYHMGFFKDVDWTIVRHSYRIFSRFDALVVLTKLMEKTCMV